MAISLVTKLFNGKGLQVDKQQSPITRNVYVPPVQTHGEGNYYPYQTAPFFGNWEKPIGMGVKKQNKTKDQKKGKGKKNITRSKQSIQLDSSFWGNFVNKALSNFDLFDWIKKLEIKQLFVIFIVEMFYQKKLEKNVE